MSVPGPTLGPCEAWISGDDVAGCCDAASNSAAYDDVALEASMLAFELSGRQFPGICEATVRPCRDRCGCSFAGILTWYDSSASGWWRNECGERCGCSPLAQIKLAGYPVREISEVKIDGDVVDDATYRLDRWRYLVRLDDPGPPVVKRRWPSCQNLALEDDQPGTFVVTYSWGAEPPPAGIAAASELACQLYLACAGDDACVLPSNVVAVERQGIRFDRDALVNFLAGGNTGLLRVDAFLTGYGRKRRPAVWSPDTPGFPRRVGG